MHRYIPVATIQKRCKLLRCEFMLSIYEYLYILPICHVCKNTLIYTYIYVYVNMHRCIYMYIHINIFTYVYIHIHIYWNIIIYTHKYQVQKFESIASCCESCLRSQPPLIDVKPPCKIFGDIHGMATCVCIFIYFLCDYMIIYICVYVYVYIDIYIHMYIYVYVFACFVYACI